MLSVCVILLLRTTTHTTSTSLSLHDALPILNDAAVEHYGFSRTEFLRMALRDIELPSDDIAGPPVRGTARRGKCRSEEHTSELQSRVELVCRLLREKKTVSAPHSRRSALGTS